MSIHRRNTGRVRLTVLVAAIVLLLSTAKAFAGPYEDFLGDLDQHHCVSQDRFDRLFDQAESRDENAWKFYVARDRGVELAQPSIPRFDHELRTMWVAYHDLLGGSPADSSHPLRIVLTNDTEALASNEGTVSGLTSPTCEASSRKDIYIFIPRTYDRAHLLIFAHELFHAFQGRRTPSSPLTLGRSSWWHEATAEWASKKLYNVHFPAGIEALAWRYPNAALDTLHLHNPGGLPERVNSVGVRDGYPYVAVPKFINFLAARFGIRPGAGFTGPGVTRFGEFLQDTFSNWRVPPGTTSRQSSRYADEIVDRAIRAFGRDWLIARDGLGGAYALFAASRMSGEEPSEISWSAGMEEGGGGRYYSYLFAPERTVTGRVHLEAEAGLSSRAVEFQPPDAGIQSVEVKIVGQLPAQGRLFFQAGSRETSPGEPGFGWSPFADVSENARSPESEAAVPGSYGLLGRTAIYCMSNGPSLRFFRWPDTGRLRVLLVNAAPGSVGSSPVSIDLDVTAHTEACVEGGRMNPMNPGGRRLKPDSDEECPDPDPKPEEAPSDWTPPPTVCDAHPAPYEAPPNEIPPLGRPMLDPWSTGRTLQPSGAGEIGSGGLDCEQNRRDRERDRRAGRRRTESERIVDRICDRLRRERERG